MIRIVIEFASIPFSVLPSLLAGSELQEFASSYPVPFPAAASDAPDGSVKPIGESWCALDRLGPLFDRIPNSAEASSQT
jgi:hypothetical protein